MKSLSISKLREQVLARPDTPRKKENLRMLDKYCKGWGAHVIIYQDKHLRRIEADSIAHRMALSSAFVRNRLDSFNLIANWSLL